MAQGGNYSTNPSNSSSDLSSSGVVLPSAGASTTSKPSKDDNKTSDDETDPNLQRLGTKDSLGEMSRDEGQLTRKLQRREKVTQVESTKQLPSSGTDPKFQGSLLHSSVTSIDDIGEKTNANVAEKTNAGADVQDEEDPRFRAKRLVFTPATGDESKKKDSPRPKADSSPSPSPSASASATPQSH